MARPYEAKYKVGVHVRVVAREALEQFKREWRYHHPLTDEQLAFAENVSAVVDVGYYHGGDPIYQLEGVPGNWHEENLSPA